MAACGAKNVYDDEKKEAITAAEGKVFAKKPKSCPKPPVRHGVWFIMPNTAKGFKLKNDTKVDTYTEFFSKHYNGCELWKKVRLVQVTWKEIEKYRKRIRIASYRWENARHWDGVDTIKEKRKENTGCPDNYQWFLEFIIKRGLLGWLDSAGIAAAGVPLSEALAYMGKIYAESVVLGDWL